MKCKTCGKMGCMAHGGKLPKPKKMDEGGRVPAPAGPNDDKDSAAKQASQGFENSGGLPSWEKIKDNVKHAFDPAPAPAGMAEGGEVDGDIDGELDDMVADELFSAIESKDKRAFRDAVHAMVMSAMNKGGFR